MKINLDATSQSITHRVGLTTEEAANYLGLTISTLNKWRCRGTGPNFVKLGRAVRYTQEELDSFIEIRTRSVTNRR